MSTFGEVLEATKKVLLVVDDIADSFDYKNKYAIIQYLMDIAEDTNFRQIILTHNFDFFRTVNSRFVKYSGCLMAAKNPTGITLKQATGIKNVFVKDWKPNFYIDSKKKIACIPFIRNMVEYTRGDTDPAFIKLTSLLHWKTDSPGIKQGDVDVIYNAVFGTTGGSADAVKPMLDLIKQEAGACVGAGDGINFENKIVLSIAIRLQAEQFMTAKLADPVFVAAIKANQTQTLLSEYTKKFAGDTATIKILQRVVLMTPENIHLNSFMYEPIVDMSDEHLRKLNMDVLGLK